MTPGLIVACAVMGLFGVVLLICALGPFVVVWLEDRRKRRVGH